MNKATGVAPAAVNEHEPRGLTMQRRKGEVAACGLCGIRAKMTRTHVPPQCAGNNHLVGRSYMRTHKNKAKLGRPTDGGLYVYGLCQRCNNLGSRYEVAYKELTDILAPTRRRAIGVDFTASQVALPAATFDPGSVARAIMIGAFGIAPTLRDEYPDLAAGLLDQLDVLPVPADLRLRLGLARGTSARIGGMTHGFFIAGRWAQSGPDGDPEAVSAYAEVFFPPLAWMLTNDQQPVLDRMGWGEATQWLLARPGHREELHSTVPALPYVSHPRHNHFLHDLWTEMHTESSAGITEIVECRNLPERL